MKSPLTAIQQAIYSYIRKYIEDHTEAPTLEQIKQFQGVASLNTIVQHLKALEQKGYIVRRKHAKRNIELSDNLGSLSLRTTVSIPVTGSVGCDDLSIFANEQHDEFIEVDKSLLSSAFSHVAVRAIGNSMNDADIHNGDYVLIQLTSDIKNGDRVAAVVDDMVTVKRFERRGEINILRPESKDPKYKPIILGENFHISGKVICSIPGDSRDMTEFVPINESSVTEGRHISF